MRSEERILIRMGATPNYKGYRFLLVAVGFARKNMELVTLVTKNLYPMVAKACDTSPYCVERNIRRVIRVAWEKNPEMMEALFGRPLTEAPTNTQFISVFAAYLNRQEEERKE